MCKLCVANEALSKEGAAAGGGGTTITIDKIQIILSQRRISVSMNKMGLRDYVYVCVRMCEQMKNKVRTCQINF